jgi:hypothetical protein
MTKQEIIAKAKNIEATIEGLHKLAELDSFVFHNDCGCSTRQEWEELKTELATIRKEMKQEIKSKR